MPRYIRDSATHNGMTTARATKIHRHQARVRPVTSTAMLAYNSIVAATCPDG